MKKILYTVVFILGTTLVKGQSFNSQLAAMLQDTLDTYVANISNIKGMSASVYIPGQGLWQGTAGISYAGQPISPQMSFGIASNSKLFVSTSMLILAENNIISLDDSLHDWLPPYPNINPDITIRQLLNHTSGVSDPIFTSPWMDTIMANPTRVFTPVEVLGWVGAPTFTAGSSWGYSNVNYILAALVAESATGFNISEIIHDSILYPLNLDSTFYDVKEPEVGIISHRWWNSVDYHDTSRVGLNSAGGAAGSIFSTSSEMAQWYHALFSGQIINQNSLNELTSFVATGSSSQNYGLGLFRETTQGFTYWGHGGDTWGYKSKMLYDTCNGTVVCGLSNSFPSGMSAVTFLLYRVVKNHIPGCSGPISGPETICQGENAVVYTVPPIANANSYIWTLPFGATGTSNTNTIVVDYSNTAVSGSIIVSGVNNYGVGGTSSLAITVNPIPQTPIITQNLNILTSSISSGNQWYNSTGAIIGETNQNLTVTVSDDYYTIVTLLGCSSDTSNILHVLVTGIHDNNLESLIDLFPNPFTDDIMIKGNFTKDTIFLTLTDMQGRVILSKMMYDEDETLNLPSLPNNMYILTLYNKNTIRKMKLVKN
ncbi:MAG: serine hydrolase [Bacteroidales bacterium]|nr:serine hydrolase [Bacteroidales bacterium]